MRQFKLDKIKATGTTVGDIYFPRNALLLPFDGSNGATTTSDSSNSNHTATFNGNAQISTAQSKFGGSSLLLDGTGDYLSFSASSDWQFATGDFTIEFWIRIGAGSAYQTIWDFNYTSNGCVLIQTTNDSSPKMRVFLDYGRTSDYITDATAFSLNTWYHYAIVRSSGTVTIYRDGTSTVSGSMPGDVDASASPTIGIKAGTTDYPLNGYLDDFRISKGLARYTSNFTAPTSAHLTSEGDVNKHIVVNSDADGVAIGTGGINQARIAKAWVYFDGTAAAASMIQGSYNVSSMTDNGTGDYQINFSTNMSDTNYSAVGSFGDTGSTSNVTGCVRYYGALSTAHTKISVNYTYDGGRHFYDYSRVYVQFFGN